MKKKNLEWANIIGKINYVLIKLQVLEFGQFKLELKG